MLLISVDGIVMFPKISELVNEAKAGEGGKYTFGVYTKWDEFMENKSRGNVPVDVEYLQKDHKQNYLEKVCGKETTATETKEEDVFFVDVGHGERFDVSILNIIRCNSIMI